MELHIVSLLYLWTLLCQATSETKDTILNRDKVGKLKDEVLERALVPGDRTLQVQLKRTLVDYLLDRTMENNKELTPWPRQEEAAETPENEDVINGVRRILQNVFSGNIAGVIQESVSIRTPGPLQTIFADIMGAIFGSNAVKGAGTIGLQQPQSVRPNGTVAPPVRTTVPPKNSANDYEGDDNDNF